MICLFKQKSMTHFRSSKHWTMLRDIWEKQDGRCPYSGIKMLLAEADLDHIQPGFTTLSNLQFVHRWANEMKRDHPETVFLAFVKRIHDHCVRTGKLRQS